MVALTNNETFKYKHEELSCDTVEYKFVKNFFETNDFGFSTLLVAPYIKQSIVKVYKISENSPTTKTKEKINNLMLFHGTDERNVNGILNKGFVNSAQGMFGKGVYMTESANTARIHSLKKKRKR